MYTEKDVRPIVHEGPLDALWELKEKGTTRFLGVTGEEPWTLRPFVADGRFDVIRARYNLIYQSAAHHLLDEASRANVGVLRMRSLTSGIFQRLIHPLAPEREAIRDVSEVALPFFAFGLAGARGQRRHAMGLRGGTQRRPR